MDVSVITTFRGTDHHRVAALARFLEHACEHTGWQVVLVEQDAYPALDRSTLPAKAEYKFIENAHAFNKSWGMNVGVRACEGDVLIISDADILMRSADMLRAVEACESELDAVRPYRSLIDMTERQTAAYYAGNRLPGEPDGSRGYDRHHTGEVLCFAGGVFVIRRDYYLQLGGMDERFHGWGGEDDAMSIKIQSQSSRVAIARDAIAWHLWHERKQHIDQDHYGKNRQLLSAYQKMNAEALGELCNNQQMTMGDPDKYKSIQVDQ